MKSCAWTEQSLARSQQSASGGVYEGDDNEEEDSNDTQQKGVVSLWLPVKFSRSLKKKKSGIRKQNCIF